MKVGTDGVLLGAFTHAPETGNILDIGTGTGLVALMLAQKSHAQIDAVEIDAGAAEQAAENVRNSPWTGRVRVIHEDFMNFYPSCRKEYGLIVSNPPYFSNSLKPETREKTLARHNSGEFYRELLRGVRHLLLPSGNCCLILPAEIAGGLEDQAQELGLHARKRIIIRSKPDGKAIRKLLTLGKTKTARIAEKEFIIYAKEREYTAEFRELVRPYYLNI